MNKSLGVKLVVYGLLLAGLSYLVHQLAPAIARPTLITGWVGGVLCLVWGLRAIRGNPGKTWPVLTLVPINFVMLSQSILGWAGGSLETPGRRAAAAVITILFGLSLGIMMLIAYAGIELEGHASSPARKQPAK